MDIILKYFPNLTTRQKEQFFSLFDLYVDWNAKINVISRKDIENLYIHHILHSLGIAKIISFKEGSHILDVGTGGGFPGIPLAILFPDCEFVLIDSIGKKIKVATEISTAIGLSNIELKHCRAQDEKRKFDFIVSRAVMPLSDLVQIVSKNILKEQKNPLPNGLICLKGGELQNEIAPYSKYIETEELNSFFDEDFFDSKKVIYLPL